MSVKIVFNEVELVDELYSISTNDEMTEIHLSFLADSQNGYKTLTLKDQLKVDGPNKLEIFSNERSSIFSDNVVNVEGNIGCRKNLDIVEQIIFYLSTPLR